MAEPQASAVIAAAAGGISLVAGSVLGLPLPALVFGFFGGLAAVKLDTQSRSLWQRVTTVALGTVSAAAAAHPVAAAAHPDGRWLPVAALVVGFGAETLLRELLQAVVNVIRRIGGTWRAP